MSLCSKSNSNASPRVSKQESFPLFSGRSTLSILCQHQSSDYRWPLATKLQGPNEYFNTFYNCKLKSTLEFFIQFIARDQAISPLHRLICQLHLIFNILHLQNSKAHIVSTIQLPSENDQNLHALETTVNRLQIRIRHHFKVLHLILQQSKLSCYTLKSLKSQKD